MSNAAASSGRPRGRPRKDAVSPSFVARPLTFCPDRTQVVEQQQIFHHHSHHHHQQQHEQQQHQQGQQRQQGQQQQAVVVGELQHDGGGEEVECAQMEDEEDLLAQQKKKEIKRSWREEWKVQHKWVYPVRKENGELRLKCQWCSAYNMDNVFAKEGCSTIQLSALNTHAKSEAHKTAEARWEGSAEAAAAAAAAAATGISGHHLTVPDNLWDFGSGGGKPSEMGHGHGDGSGDPGLEESDLNGSCGGGLPRKRRLAATAAAAASGGSARLAEALLEAEAGRSKRHAAELGLLKRQHALEDQRLRLDGERLAFERARLDAMVRLGHQYSAAMASIGSGLLKIGAALQSSAAAAPPRSPPSRDGP